MAKVEADALDDAQDGDRQSSCEFVYDFMLNTYGLKRLAESAVWGLFKKINGLRAKKELDKCHKVKPFSLQAQIIYHNSDQSLIHIRTIPLLTFLHSIKDNHRQLRVDERLLRVKEHIFWVLQARIFNRFCGLDETKYYSERELYLYLKVMSKGLSTSGLFYPSEQDDGISYVNCVWVESLASEPNLISYMGSQAAALEFIQKFVAAHAVMDKVSLEVTISNHSRESYRTVDEMKIKGTNSHTKKTTGFRKQFLAGKSTDVGGLKVETLCCSNLNDRHVLVTALTNIKSQRTFF
jgi:hypothetical protein